MLHVGLEGWERSRGFSRSEGRDEPFGLVSARRAAWWESVAKEKREFGKTGARGGGASELWRATHGLPAELWRFRLMRAGVRRGRIDSSKKRDSRCLVRSSATKGARSARGLPRWRSRNVHPGHVLGPLGAYM